MSIERGTALVRKWSPRFGLGNYRITVQPIAQKDSENSWAMSYFDTHEEWGLVELPNDDSLPPETLELLVLHELSHGLLKLAGGDGERDTVEATCNRIARLARGDFQTPLMNEHAASVLGPMWFEDNKRRAAEAIDRRAWLPVVTDGLPEQEREVVTLLYYEGLSLRQAAEVLGVAHTTVEDRRDRALKRLHAYFAALDRKFGDA